MQASFARPSPTEKARMKGKVYHVLLNKNAKYTVDKKATGSQNISVKSGGWCKIIWRVKNKSEKDWAKGV